MNRAAILGAGSWGTALSTLLGRCEQVTLWDRDRAVVEAIDRDHENARYLPGVCLGGNVAGTPDLDAALDGADCVVFAVPSGGMRDAATVAAPRVPEGALVVSASKGLEDATGYRMSQIIAEAAGRPLRLAALSGPNLAVEVSRGIPTASVAASPDAATAAACRDLWMGPTFRVYVSDDMTGVELAGATKNVIAIGAGVCEGIGYGDNSRAAFMTRGLAEITRLGVALGAHPSTFLGLAGVGDLIATGGSRLSRNYRVGVGLGQGKTLDAILAEIGQVAEGVPTTRAICHLAERTGVEMPISQAIYRLVFEGASVRDTVAQLMLRPPRSEAEF